MVQVRFTEEFRQEAVRQELEDLVGRIAAWVRRALERMGERTARLSPSYASKTAHGTPTAPGMAAPKAAVRLMRQLPDAARSIRTAK